MPKTIGVPLADLTPIAPATTTARLRVPLADLTPVVSRQAAPRPSPAPPRVSTPPPAAATRGMLPPSTMAGDPAPFNAPRVVTAAPPVRARGAGPVGQP